MKRCIVSYYPSTNKIHNIYDTVEDAKESVKMCNLFSNGREKLMVAIAELTDEEYRDIVEGEKESEE